MAASVLTISSAEAAPAPTPIALGTVGMSSAACPLPLNGSIAIAPGTTVQFKPDVLLHLLQTLSVSIQLQASPKPAPVVKNVPAGGVNVAFPTEGTYDLSWHTVTAGLLGTTLAAKLVVSPNAQKCVVAVQVPVPSVALPVPVPVLSPVTSIVNEVAGTVVNGVNGALAPVNDALGPVLGGVNSTVGGLTSGLTGGSNPGTGPAATPEPSASPGASGASDQPTSLVLAGQPVPTVSGGVFNGAFGFGAAIGAGTSINAPLLGLAAGTAISASSDAPVKSGGSPETVELAANKPRAALSGWSTVVILLALIALSGATAFYARTYLLHPVPRKALA